MTIISDSGREERCRRLAAAVPLVAPGTVDGLVRAVAMLTGTAIRLAPLPAAHGPEVSGECIVTSSGVLVRYPQAASRVFALTALAHEMGHILCGHLDGVAGTVRNTTTRAVDGLLPDLQEAHRAWGLYRCSLPEAIEQEAELVASLLVDRMDRLDPAPLSATGNRFAELLGHSRRRQR